MKLTGFRNYLWEADGFRAGIPNGGMLTGTVVPQVVQRVGRTPVFGVGSVTEMTVPCEFIYSGNLTYEKAWLYLASKLLPLDPTPATLTGTLNDGTAVSSTAVMTVPAMPGDDVNVLLVTFVCVPPVFTAVVRSTTVQVFA